jgi:hypothetical protein
LAPELAVTFLESGVMESHFQEAECPQA